jgi:hypothetical protein
MVESVIRLAKYLDEVLMFSMAPAEGIIRSLLLILRHTGDS